MGKEKSGVEGWQCGGGWVSGAAAATTGQGCGLEAREVKERHWARTEELPCDQE